MIDAEAILLNIELTRFPVPNGEEHSCTVSYPGLVRAADLLGQLSDPRYLQKMPALFYEFEEIGTNETLGYRHPADLRAGYPKFFWNVVYRYIQEGLQHLEMTKNFKGGTRHAIDPWNQSQIFNAHPCVPRIYPWGQSKIFNAKIAQSIDQEFQRWYPPRDLSVESIPNLQRSSLRPPDLSVGSIPNLQCENRAID
ncbi:hypothetical protein [Microcoleus sp. ARI1-A5]|uniref:hypothetical protein n=1 Tax=unclassified Microcoleus TaxID=2642155 RepID=UPI003FA56579